MAHSHENGEEEADVKILLPWGDRYSPLIEQRDWRLAGAKPV